CTGYEIHMGESRICEENAQGFIQLTNQSDLSTRADGCVRENVAGTYLHGIFDEVGFCGRLIETLCRQKGMNSAVSGQMSFWEYKQREYDKLADVIRENMDMEYLYRVMGLA
ncbi:MAG: cobyric acid synthase CobQ, partial [Lachnospira sp.]